MLNRQPGLSLAQIATLVQGQLQGNPGRCITGLATLDQAGPEQLAFATSQRYGAALATSRAGVVLIPASLASSAPGDYIVVADPYLSYAKVSQAYDWRQVAVPGIAATACISPTAVVDEQAQVGPGVVIGERSRVEAGVVIGPNCVIGNDCVIGAHTYLQANVTLYDAVRLGQRNLIHAGAVLGADGFGFAPSPQGWVKIAQLAGVVLGDDVEVGAGTTIDRGALQDTRIGNGVKLDNQIQIAHNVEIGDETAIAGCTAVAGSTKIGRRCTIAGLSGICGHLSLADNTHVTAMTLVSKSINEPGQVVSSGTGQQPYRDWTRNVVRFRHLDEMAKRLAQLEQTVNKFSTEG